MNNRISTVVAAAILVTFTSGCCNMSTLWFGRGARCGLCNKFSGVTQPAFGNVMQAPCGCQGIAPPPPVCPTAPVQPPVWQAPRYQPPTCTQPTCTQPTCQAAPADCGCNSYAEVPSSEPCSSCHRSGYADCGCGGAGSGQSGVVVDPYLSGGTSSPSGAEYGVPQPGQVINGEVVVAPGTVTPGYGGQVNQGPGVPGTTTIAPDNFQRRNGTVYPQGSGTRGSYPPGTYQSNKFDTDGKKILWEEPLPSGNHATSSTSN